MGEERIELSARERERLKVLHEIQQGHWSRAEASGRLRLSTRQVRRAEGGGMTPKWPPKRGLFAQNTRF